MDNDVINHFRDICVSPVDTRVPRMSLSWECKISSEIEVMGCIFRIYEFFKVFGN